MKKAKTLKLLAIVFAFALVISSLLLVTASADDSSPEIVSVNIAYEGDYAIVVAIDAATVKGTSVSVQVWDETGADKGIYKATATEKIEALDPAKDYYVVKTPGISAKDMDKEYTYQAIDGDTKGKVEKMSVAEYFYTRLFINKIAEAEAGTPDGKRKDFYLHTLENAAMAQDILYNLDNDPDNDITVFVTDLIYANVTGYNFGGFSTALLKNNTTKIVLPGTAEDEFKVVKYDPATLQKTETTAAGGTEITIDAHTVATSDYVPPVTVPGAYFPDSSKVGLRYDMTDPEPAKNMYEFWTKNTPDGTALTLVDHGADKAVYVQRVSDATPAFTLGFRNNDIVATTEHPANHITVLEFDAKFDGIPAGTANVWRMDIFTSGVTGKQATLYFGADAEGRIRLNSNGGVHQFRLDQETWYNLRFVLDLSGNLKIYVDGELQTYSKDGDVVDSFVPNNADAAKDGYARMEAQINNTLTTVNAGLALDNFFLGADVTATTDTPDEPDTPPVEEAGTRGTGVFFNNTSAAGKRWDMSATPVKANYTEFWTSTNPDGAVAELVGATDKALYVHRTGSANPKFTLGYRNTDITSSTAHPTNYIGVWELDAKFDGIPADKTNIWRVDLFTGGVTGQHAVMYFGADADGKVRLNGEGGVHSFRLEQNTWYNIRITIDLAGNCKIYVDGTLQTYKSGEETKDSFVPYLDASASNGYSRMEMQINNSNPEYNVGLAIDNFFMGASSEGDPVYPETPDPEVPDIPTEVTGTRGTGVYFKTESLPGKRWDMAAAELKGNYTEWFTKTTADGTAISQTDDADKALYVQRTGTANPSFTLGYRNTDITDTTAHPEGYFGVWEMDMKFDGMSANDAGVWRVDLFTGGATGRRATIYFGADANGKVRLNNEGGVHSFRLDQNTWYNIRFELDLNGNLKIYVDGTLQTYKSGEETKDSFVPYNAGSANNGYTRMEMQVNNTLTTVNAGLALDNFFMGAGVAELPGEGEVTGPVMNGTRGQGYYYLNGSDANDLKWAMESDTLTDNYREFGSGSAEGAKLAVLAVGDNKVLHVDRTAGYNTKVGYLTWRNYGADNALAGDTLPENYVSVYEFDILFDGMADNTARIWRLNMMSGSKNGRYGTIYFGTDANGKVRLNNNGGVYGFRLEQNTWYNIRFEVDNTTGNVKVYVDNVLQTYTKDGAEVDNFSPDNNGANANGRMEFQINSNGDETSATDIYLDNMFLGGYVKEAE